MIFAQASAFNTSNAPTILSALAATQVWNLSCSVEPLQFVTVMHSCPGYQTVNTISTQCHLPVLPGDDGEFITDRSGTMPSTTYADDAVLCSN